MNSAIVNVIRHTCAFSSLVPQNVCIGLEDKTLKNVFPDSLFGTDSLSVVVFTHI